MANNRYPNIEIRSSNKIKQPPSFKMSRQCPIKKKPSGFAKLLFYLAGELGFEPRLTESESVVLPLDDSPIFDYCNPRIKLATRICRRIIQQLINDV